MNVYIEGHNCQNALREIIHAFTGCSEIHFRPAGERREGDWVYSGLNGTNLTTEICAGGRVFRDVSDFSRYKDNFAQNAVKAGYYLLARKVYGRELPWGSLTGIRPSKMAENFIMSGQDPACGMRDMYFVSPRKARLAADCARAGLELGKRAAGGASLYVSIPFCPTRCLYCSFISTPVRNFEKQIDPYLELLLREIAYTGALVKGMRFDTVYIGGGTPGILTADALARLLDGLFSGFDLSAVQEFTLEAGRPDTITAQKLAVAKNMGITRISINPQTLNDTVLQRIGRRHTAADFAAAFELARQCGYDNINTDIIAGLPSEDGEMFLDSLGRLLAFRPESVTVHTMCVKRASRLKNELNGDCLKGAGEAALMVETAEDTLRKTGYSPYYMYRQKDTLDNLENTGYSLPGRECLYNVLMMGDMQSIIAVGAGGVTKLVSGGKIERLFNMKNPTDYIARFDQALARKKIMASLLEKK